MEKQERSPRYNKSNTTNRTAQVSMRLTNEEIDAVDEIRDLGGFASRADVLRVLFRPSLQQFVTAIQTKSVAKAGIVKIKEEMAMNAKLQECIKASEVQTELFTDYQTA
jgi:Arc/MetJ-type ribon-helix-helix transcriptional regulator